MRRFRYPILSVLALFALGTLAACGDANPSLCKKACSKLYSCDTEADGSLAPEWEGDCRDLCDKVESIDEQQARCILNHACAELETSCSVNPPTPAAAP